MSPFDLAEALIRIGEDDKAEELLGAAIEPMRAAAWVAAGLARCRALAGGQGFEALYAESRAVLDSIGFVFEVARTDLYLGETLRRRRAAAARPASRSPERSPRSSDWAPRRGPGVPAPVCERQAPPPSGSRRTGTAELSERERQVAVAAAAGRTNREIAAELFLSHRTVELHLAAAFRKLGIRRRTELAQVAGPAGEPGHT